MSLQRLLSEPATVVTFTAGVDPRGDGDQGVWADVDSWLGRFQQTTGSETVDGRDTTVSDWLLILPRQAVVGPHDRIRDGQGQLFDVIGLPAAPTRPGTGVHHLEVRLRAVVDS